MNTKAFYLTTTLPYVNAVPHMGHALEFVQADIIVRYKRLQGYEVFFNTGTDEHGIKIFKKAQEVGKDPQSYVDEYAGHFKNLLEKLSISEHVFTRTTNEDHKKVAQEFWRRCEKNGFIEKRHYKAKYCVGCELEKTDSELIDGKCELHPNLEIETIEEENYFFKFSQFQEKLLKLYKENPNFVFPEVRLNEIRAFVERGLQDFSISRLKEKMPWGVEVPDDPDHVMYVWFDALVNYISTLGWPNNTENFEKFWGTTRSPNAVQIAGKDNLRQQSAMWQAMLMAAELPPSKQILIHGFITSGGQKMSKSLGNVINPMDIINEYGTDALRYFLAREVNTFEDSDLTMERFKEAYNANLANGLGNLVARIMKMAENYLDIPVVPWLQEKDQAENIVIGTEKYRQYLGGYNLDKAIDEIWKIISEIDSYIQKEEPFKLIKTDKQRAQKTIQNLVENLDDVRRMLEPFMPETAEKIKTAIKENKMPEPLFRRKE